MKTELKGKNFVGQVFILRKLDEDGSGGDFETSYAKTETPVKSLDTTKYPPTLIEGIIKRVHYRLNPTNAVTYTLRLYAGAQADNYASNLRLLYESPALQADDVDYDDGLPNNPNGIPFRLATQGKIYFAIEWTGAPGTTSGFIQVEGVVLK